MSEHIVLVENGRSCAVIVKDATLDRSAELAVRDFVETIAEMSGAALPVLSENESRSGRTEVHIGNTPYVQKSGISVEGIPVNGYRIVTKSGRLIITGSDPLGISHGIYSVLTDELGVLWGMADPLFRDVPKRTTVSLDSMDRTEKPLFTYRVYSGNNPDWLRRNRIDNAGRVRLPMFGHGHNLFRIFPPSKYGDHPEYYSMRDGERLIPEDDNHTHIQPCLTNPDVIRITIETVRKHFDENPQVATYSLCPNDSDRFCECPECCALDDTLPEYRGRRMTSNSYFAYVKAVAEEVMKTHPDRYLGVYAYWTTELPPQNIDRLPSNVSVLLTQDTSQYFDPEYERRDHELLEEWAKFADNLGLYDYYGLGWKTPRYYPGVVKKNLPYLPTVNVRGLYCETYPHWANFGPQLFLATRVMWDVETDADAVMQQWYERMFGAAADAMKEFYETLERSWMDRLPKGQWFHGLNNIYLHLIHFTPSARETAWGCLTQAMKTAPEGIHHRRVDCIRQGFRFAYLMSRAFNAAKELERADDESIGAIIATVKETLAVYHQAIEADMNYPSPYYRGQKMEREFAWWKGYIASRIDASPGGTELFTEIAENDSVAADLLACAADTDLQEKVTHDQVRAKEHYGEEFVR